MELADSLYNSYVFTNEDTIMKGGYRFQKSIKRSIRRSPSAKRTPMLIGGADDNYEENDFHRFENLVIPLGLVLNSYKNLSNNLQIKEFNQEHIDSETFDKLLDSIVHRPNYTKIKNKTPKDKKSKKNKGFINNITKRILP